MPSYLITFHHVSYFFSIDGCRRPDKNDLAGQLKRSQCIVNLSIRDYQVSILHFCVARMTKPQHHVCVHDHQELVNALQLEESTIPQRHFDDGNDESTDDEEE